MKLFKRALFIFRRDLRLSDNTGLLAAMRESNQVAACFIFDPLQVEEHPYRSLNALQFLVESLDDLGKQVQKHGGRLHILYGKTDEVVETVLKKLTCDALFFNTDYTPFSKKRDDKLEKLCKRLMITCKKFDDTLLVPPQTALKDNDSPYTIFTPFFKKMVQRAVLEPQKFVKSSWYTENIQGSLKELRSITNGYKNMDIAITGGRNAGKKLLIAATQNLSNYAKIRDQLQASTSTLSAHLKFGTISAREAYHSFRISYGPSSPLIRQLYWRDFLTTIAYHYPKVFGAEFNEKYATVRWSHNQEAFVRWCKGTTGFPIIDAAMRELNTSGYMHNRARMIVASFLTKDLHIDWRWGEKYFATQLVDYDPAINNGNWQWAASTGCDAQPYFRVFNPWLQQKKFDPLAIYIKRWVPELKNLSPAQIHKLYSPKTSRPDEYPKPMVDHAIESKIAIQRFRVLKQD